MDILMISGSRNPEGKTGRAANALLERAQSAGAETESVFLPELEIDRCRQCDERGWGLCRREGRCVIDDDFASLVDKISAADALVVATPVYFSDLSESLRALLDRLRRTCTHEAGRERVEGTVAVGVCVAGGGGGGAPACCVSLEKVLRQCSCDVVDLVPVRRQNLDHKLDTLKLTGEWLAAGAGSE
ncbi:MAG: flavodoxin family protein [Planctomycetota bacterium]